MEKLQEQADDPLLGCTLPGGHVVLELIDVGGMGRVYRAEQKMLGRTVAVKIIHPHLLGDETVEARFITEARAASQLNHPNSVGVIDFGKFEGRLYMVMEYLRGRDLATVAHEEGPLELDRIVDIMNQTLAALEEAHHVGIIHRDLKPENIVLSPLRSGGDFVKVLDFGLAKVLEVAKIASNRRITDPGMVCGTPEYMAPEQARGDDLDHRADLYACGVLLYELLAGQLPFEGATPREVVLMHLSQLPPDLNVMAPSRDLPPALVDVVMKALAKEPTDRFQSASAMADALNKALGPATKSRAVSLANCPSCGALMPLRQKFCGECGSSMTPKPAEEQRAPQVDEGEERAAETTLPLAFVGRDDELARLVELRAESKDSPVAVEIVGQVGAGKTRLLDEFLVRAEKWGDVVVRSGPDPWWAKRGYYALRQAIRALAELPEDGGGPSMWPGASPETRAGLDAIFERDGGAAKSKAGGRWSETPPLGPGEGSRRVLVAEALRWAIERAQDRVDDHSVIVALDDLQSIDGASLNAFIDVIADPPLAPAIVVGCRSPDFDSGWENSETIEVQGLPIATAMTLLGDDDGSGVRRAAEAEATRGDTVKRVSPMYVEQLARFSLEGGEDPPSKLADLIALRIERLVVDARRVLQAVAVLGNTTHQRRLSAVLPDVDSVEPFVRHLEEEGFIAVEDDRIRTTHPLIRDICLASMPRAIRATLHSRSLMDRSLEGGDPAGMPLEVEAEHAFHAGASFEALMLLERVAEQARERADVTGMVTALRHALDLARREMMVGNLDDPVSAVLMFSCKLGDALVLAGKQTDAEGVLTEALNLAGPSSAERSRILASLANVARDKGRADAAYQRLDEAVKIAEKANHPNLLEMLERTRRLWIQGIQ
jgi:serine/threonine-protein kinase